MSHHDHGRVGGGGRVFFQPNQGPRLESLLNMRSVNVRYMTNANVVYRNYNDMYANQFPVVGGGYREYVQPWREQVCFGGELYRSRFDGFVPQWPRTDYAWGGRNRYQNDSKLEKVAEIALGAGFMMDAFSRMA